jgi:antitoxin VapB
MPALEARMNEHKLPNQRSARLFRNGRNQAIRIPVEFELPGEEVLITEQDGKLIIEPKKKPDLLDVLRRMEPLTEGEWPDITDDDLIPLDDVEL